MSRIKFPKSCSSSRGALHYSVYFSFYFILLSRNLFSFCRKFRLVMRRIDHTIKLASRFPEVALNQPVAPAEGHIRPRAVRRLKLIMTKRPRAFVGVFIALRI